MLLFPYVYTFRDKSPGQHECDSAVETLNAVINQLDNAGMAILAQNLAPDASSSLEGFQEQLVQCTADIGDIVGPLTVAAKSEAENLGHRVTALANLFPSLASAAVGTASKTRSSQLQTTFVQETKTVVESALQLVYASKEAGGNPKVHTHTYRVYCCLLTPRVRTCSYAVLVLFRAALAFCAPPDFLMIRLWSDIVYILCIEHSALQYIIHIQYIVYII